MLPLVDIVIPVYNKSNLVLRLLESLRSQKRLGQIIIVDDASQESDRAVLDTLTDVKILRNRGSEGFDRSVNRGCSKAENDYLLILNSDTEAYHDHCLQHMAERLDDGAAVCGALLLYPKDDQYRAERIQHAGVAIGFDQYPYHILANMHAHTPAAQIRRRVTAVTGACLMTTKKWWDKAGGFDEHYSPGVFEDVSLCLTVKKLGGYIMYEPTSVWTHFEHASQGQNGNWFSREHLHKNYTYLMTKHGGLPCDDSIWYKGVE